MDPCLTKGSAQRFDSALAQGITFFLPNARPLPRATIPEHSKTRLQRLRSVYLFHAISRPKRDGHSVLRGAGGRNRTVPPSKSPPTPVRPRGRTAKDDKRRLMSAMSPHRSNWCLRSPGKVARGEGAGVGAKKMGFEPGRNRTAADCKGQPPNFCNFF